MNIRGRVKRASVALLLLLIPTICFADVNKPVLISDVSTTTVRSETIRLSDRNIQYSISYQSNLPTIYSELYASHNPDRITYIIKESWILLKEFMDAKGIRYNDCRHTYNINIYVLDRSIMNDTVRFGNYFNYRGKPATPLWAYYDSTIEVEDDSAILVTDISENLNEEIFAHELAHYWWDRLCLANQWPNDTEHFARQYEVFYRERR